MPHLLIVGGSDAGIMAALRARELSPATEVTVVVADRFPNFFLSGEVTDWRHLAHRTTADIERAGIRLLLEHSVTAVHPARKAVTLRSGRGEQELIYDTVVLATGAVSSRPQLPGLDLPGVYLLLRRMDDAFAFHRHSPSAPHNRSSLWAEGISVWKWLTP
jgi:NADPH-dependent 2,4-dienoyl-CoA reductase/sulfur reductase-like enzyme